MRLNHNTQRGFTLIEVTIILLVLVILATIMLPQLGNFNRLARFVKAREDVSAICANLKKMLDEVMLGAVYADPPPNGAGSLPIGLLVGPGDIPLDGSEGDGECLGCNTNELNWQLESDPITRYAMTADNGRVGGNQDFLVDDLVNHLQQNNPAMGMARGGGSRYKNPLDNPERWAAGAYFGWRGPYFDELSTDPWGNRYAVNTFGLYKKPTKGNDSIYTTAVVCYSAGVDRGIDTVINQPMDDADNDGFFGWRFGDDDIGAVLSAGGVFEEPPKRESARQGPSRGSPRGGPFVVGGYLRIAKGTAVAAEPSSGCAPDRESLAVVVRTGRARVARGRIWTVDERSGPACQGGMTEAQ